MLYSVLGLCIFSFVIILQNYKNKLTWIVCFLIWGLGLSLFSMVLIVTKTGNYYLQSTHFFYSFDQKLYVGLLSLNIPFSHIIRMLNGGVALSIFALILLKANFYKRSMKPQPKKRMTGFFLTLLLPVSYLLFYDPDSSYFFYVRLNILRRESTRIFHNMHRLIELADLLFYLSIIVLVVLLLHKIKNLIIYSETGFVRKQLLCLGVSIIIFVGIYVMIFYFCQIRKPYLLHSTLYHFLAGNELDISKNTYYFLSLSIFISVMLIFVLLLKFRGLMAISFLKKFFIQNKARTVRISYRSIFHTFKNTLFAIQVTSERGIIGDSVKEKQEVLQEINLYSSEAVNNISKLLDSINDVIVNPGVYNLAGCIEEAITRAEINHRIQVIRSFELSSHEIFADRQYLVEALVNILNNASEAICQTDLEQGIIEISVILEMEWIIIKVTDNGCGIQKCDIKKIFKPFYSTKGKNENWGVGLHFAMNIIKAHLGIIHIVSRVNHGTTIEVMLPSVKVGVAVE